MRSAHALTIEDRVVVPEAAFEHPGYREWVQTSAYPERVRTTFVGGEILIEMTPESIEAHSKVKAAVTLGVGSFVRAHDLGEMYPDGVLVTHEAAGLTSEPDLTFVAWDSFETGRVRLVERPQARGDYLEVLGAPDLIVEIVSDSSVRKDTVLLRDAYLRAGVREYWLIDARGTEIRCEILWNAGEKWASSDHPFEPQESRVLGGRWTLVRRRNRLGRFEYSLTHDV